MSQWTLNGGKESLDWRWNGVEWNETIEKEDQYLLNATKNKW